MYQVRLAPQTLLHPPQTRQTTGRATRNKHAAEARGGARAEGEDRAGVGEAVSEEGVDA